jgi:HK97 family phage prohead protease
MGSVKVERRDDGGMPKLSGHSAVFNSKSEDLGFFTRSSGRAPLTTRSAHSTSCAWRTTTSTGCSPAPSTGRSPSWEDKRGLYMEAEPMDTQVCRDTITEVESLLLNGQSFSFDIETDSWRMEGGTQLREIIKVARLYDVGPVVFPAYPATDVKARGLMVAAGVDVEGFSSAMVKQIRHLPLSPADRDIVKRAIAVLQLAEDEGRQAPPESIEEITAPEAWRMQHLRRKLELAAVSA